MITSLGASAFLLFILSIICCYICYEKKQEGMGILAFIFVILGAMVGMMAMMDVNVETKNEPKNIKQVDN